METFLYSRLNKICRIKDKTAILTLGPFSVALTRIIDSAERNKDDLVNGEFVCYRGISLPNKVLNEWCQNRNISLDGYSSSSRDESLAMYFAFDSAKTSKDTVPVLLVIKIKNESSKHYFCMDKPDYTCFPDEKEILLQAGLVFNLDEFSRDSKINKIYLSTSEKKIRNHRCKQNFVLATPFVISWFIQTS